MRQLKLDLSAAMKHFLQRSAVERGHTNSNITFERQELFPGVFKCFPKSICRVGAEKKSDAAQRNSLKISVQILEPYKVISSILNLAQLHNYFV